MIEETVAETEPSPPEATREAPWFRLALTVVVLGALVLRIAYVFAYRRNFDPGGDAFFYHSGANLLADGKGFISPQYYKLLGIHRQAAEHPPLYLVYLAIPSVLGMKSVLTHLLWSCLLGTGTVWLVGLLGRAVGGARVGIIAAVGAAVYPNIWAPDGQLQAETMSMFVAVAIVLLAYRYWQQPNWKRIVVLGAACGFGALARSELVLFVPLILVPLVWATRGVARKVKWQWFGVSVLAAAVVIAPWALYNTARFAHPIPLSAQIDPLLASANCDSVYYGQFQGYFDITCAMKIADKDHITLADDESQENIIYRREALDYIRGHLSRLPEVEGVRLLRIVGLYKTSMYVHADWYVEGRRPYWITWSGLYSFWALALLAIAGAVVWRRRRANAPPMYPLLAPIIVVVITVLVTYASTRFRTTAEPSIVVLAAFAIDAAWVRMRDRYASARN
jgi:4-amino-4-deoxy-L-arabinose transferase-like glycosyltransferase